ncbi:hypothetical protein GOP47_0021458 [Adiantum capillus-veneris]|uniref:Uncharacterized protein n=1 Tax=Adiantum capillus-veneris TaxID=13818 RepID=A0A9D4U9M4_ADICA|nr:hypothetical protein GOP47_0021458 [Adiantum capillus-veneris]
MVVCSHVNRHTLPLSSKSRECAVLVEQIFNPIILGLGGKAAETYMLHLCKQSHQRGMISDSMIYQAC